MVEHSHPGAPALRGGLLAVLAALLFGVSTPLIQRLGAGLGAFTTAALLYAGAAGAGALLRQPPEHEARLRRSDLARLVWVAIAGALVGPVTLAWGLQRTSGTSASLMLTLEAVFTAVLAWRFYGETLDRRVAAAMALLAGGGVALVLDQRASGAVGAWGLLAVLVATAAWGLDNAWSRPLAERSSLGCGLVGDHARAQPRPAGLGAQELLQPLQRGLDAAADFASGVGEIPGRFQPLGREIRRRGLQRRHQRRGRRGQPGELRAARPAARPGPRGPGGPPAPRPADRPPPPSR